MAREVRSHQDLAAALRARVLESGRLRRELRVLALDGDGANAPVPYSALIVQVRDESFRVTDGQVDAVRRAVGSEKEAFELVLASAIGAGLERWEVAVNAIREAGDATS
jgi:hypothetical protein